MISLDLPAVELADAGRIVARKEEFGRSDFLENNAGAAAPACRGHFE